MMTYNGGRRNGGVDWSYFGKFAQIDEKYLPAKGEGETMATQICTAVNKLIYKWYNDGDVYDNTAALSGWCNDLSSYANWLAEYVDGAMEILRCILACRLYKITPEALYEQILKMLADTFLTEECLDKYAKVEKRGSVYDCEGVFQYEEPEEEEEDEEQEDDI